MSPVPDDCPNREPDARPQSVQPVRTTNPAESLDVAFGEHCWVEVPLPPLIALRDPVEPGSVLALLSLQKGQIKNYGRCASGVTKRTQLSADRLSRVGLTILRRSRFGREGDRIGYGKVQDSV